jgi:AraC family transcriptional regulator
MSDDVEIVTIPDTRVAYIRHVGPYGSPAITELWRRFESWCATQGLMPSRRRRFGIAQDNPNLTPADRTRYDACIEIDPTFQPAGEIGVQTIRGRHACTRFRGTAADIQAAWVKFLGWTLPRAGYHPDLAPAIEIYEPDSLVDPKTGLFTCQLCMPLLTR